MAINERLIDTEVAAANGGDGGAASAEQNLILHLDANDVDSYDGDGSVWYDISEHDLTIPLSDNADDLQLHLNASDSTSYGGSGTTWTDISGNSRTVTSGSGIAAADFDKDNGGYWNLTQNTSDYFSVPHNDDLHPTDTGGNTFEFWVYPNGGNDTQMIAQKHSSGSFDYYMNLHDQLGWELRLYIGGSQYICRHNADKTKGKWYHVVFTISSNVNPTVKLYLNGELKTTSNFTGTVDSNSDRPIEFGRYSTGSPNDFNGRYGCVRYYSKALSASEVGQNYRHGRDYIYTDLVDDTDLELHLDAGDDTTVSASTWSDKANSNNGTLTNFSSTLTDFYDKELGNWITFDGSNDYVSIPSNTDLQNSNDFSIEVWVNVEDYADGSIISQSNSSNENFNLKVDTSGSTRQLKWNIYGTNAFQTLDDQTVLQLNKWMHIVAQVTSTGDSELYVNGIRELNSGAGYSAGTSAYVTEIGRRLSAGQPEYFDGKIGQVRYYSSALDADEIMQNYLFTKNNYPNEIHFTGVNISSADWNSNGYFDFDGSTEYFGTSGTPSALINATDFTVSAWVWRTSGQTGTNIIAGQTTSDGVTQNWILSINGSGGDLNFHIYGTDDYTSASNVLSYETWTHIAGVVEADGTKRMYKNGVLQGSSSSGKSADTQSYNTFVGSLGTYSNKWNGRIGAVKYYKKALTAEELLADYNATKSTYGL